MERFYGAAYDKDLIRSVWEDTLFPGEDDSEEAFEDYWAEREHIGDPDGREYDDSGYEVYDGSSTDERDTEEPADADDGGY